MDRRKDHAPPANWQDFEDLCLKLWRPRLVDAKKNGRAGQPQSGVDIFGRDPKSEAWVGIQCKPKGQWPPRDLTIAQIKNEIRRAAMFKPRLSHYIIATTAPRDARSQEFVRRLNYCRRKGDTFTVDLYVWDDFQDWLDKEASTSRAFAPAMREGRRRNNKPPDHWQDFADLCFKLWRPRLVDLEKNGRTGQPQASVDIFGRDLKSGTWVGIQWRQLGQWPKRVLKVRDIEREVKGAEAFRPQLSHFIIATTAPRDAEAQEFVRKLCDQRRAEGKFTVDLFTWDDIDDLLNEESTAVASGHQAASGNADATAHSSKLPITRTTHPLPLDRIPPSEFERLTLWLVELEKYKRVEALGEAGNEQGRDLIGWKDGHRVAFQCKRVRQFGPKSAEAEIEKIDGLSKEERPDELIFVVTCAVSARTRKKARAAWGDEQTCHFWAGNELDHKVKQHPEILEEFFGIASSPKPSFTSESSRKLAKSLEAAYRRHEELTLAGADTGPALVEILKIKRRLREGGQLQPGDYLGDGRFRLLEQLGRGGFATVFQAYDQRDVRLVAVKVLHGQYASDRSRRERFFRGARKMSQLQHQGIVRVVEQQIEDAGYHAFAMEYVDGGDLRRAVVEGRLSGVEGLRTLRPVTEALDFAHAQDIVHRDVKPANILLTATGKSKLTDFDLVRAHDTTGGTRTGRMLGSFLYAAPEAMRQAKEVDAKADLYSLAMTMIFVLAGEELPPIVLKNTELFLADIEAPTNLKQTLLAATSWDPRERPGSARELLSAVWGDQAATSWAPGPTGIEARLSARVADRHTGDTGERPFPTIERIAGWLVTPHYKRGPERALKAQAELNLEVRSTAQRVSSRTLSARVEVVMYRADRSEVLREAVELREPDGGPHAFNLEWLADEKEPYWKLSGVRRDAALEWPIAIPLALDFERIPTPLLGGDDYIVEVQLHPTDGQSWPAFSARHGLRIGPDSRQADLVLEVAAGTAFRSKELVWRAIDRHVPIPALEVEEPASWNVGRDKTFTTLARLRIDNLARTGNGQVTLMLRPAVAVDLGEKADTDLEPTYAAGRRDVVELRLNGKWVKLSNLLEAREWTIANDAPAAGRQVEIAVRFNAHGIINFDREIRKYPYVVTLPFTCRVWKDARTEAETQDFELQLSFEVVRHAGDYVLAVDFGASRIVAAFADSVRTIALRNGEFSAATLDLQSRYHDVLAERGGLEVESEKAIPNPEQGTRFIPSQLVWRANQRLGDSDFVYLPATLDRLTQQSDRAIHHLVGLILRGDEHLPDLGHPGEPVEWIDEISGEPRSDPPPVDGVLRSAYRGLLDGYLEPILATEEKHELLDKLVFAHPNNFTLGHKERLRTVLRSALGQRFRIDFLSESNAVAIYCAYPRDRFLPPGAADERQNTLLIYNIGAGTLDITLTQLEWGGEEEAYALQRMKVLFQSGVPVAGNRLDIALAQAIDSKVRQLKKQLALEGIDLDYFGAIVDPRGHRSKRGFDQLSYLSRMNGIKLAIHRLKVELSEQARTAGDKPFTVHVPLDARPDLAAGVLRYTTGLPESEAEKILVAHGIRTQSTMEKRGVKKTEEILIPLTSEEIYGYPAVEAWLAQVTDEIISDLAGALDEMALKPSVDALVLSGRTSLFPPLQSRLLGVLESHLGLDREKLHMPELNHTESKEAVALGSLYYGLLFRQGVHFEDRSVWAKYGVIYETGKGPRFQEFFGYTTQPDSTKGDRVVERGGHRVTLFRRRKDIIRAGGPVEIAVTFSHNPDRDLRDPRLRGDKFTVLRTLGRDVLGAGRRVTLEMAIDEQSRLEVRVDPAGLSREVERIAYRHREHLPQLDWPYSPLKGVIEMPRKLEPTS